MNEGILNLKPLIEDYKQKEAVRTLNANKIVYDCLDESPYYRSNEEYLDHGYCVATSGSNKNEGILRYEDSLRADMHS